MLARSRLARCSTLMLAVYLVCMAFVFSFILFEVLDIDGITGGFNFQAAWTTGWIAGHAMAGVEPKILE